MTDPTATPTEGEGEPVVAPTETKTYADWAAIYPELAGDAETAFRNAYGPSADQLMDKATLDARIAALEPVEAPPAADTAAADTGYKAGE